MEHICYYGGYFVERREWNETMLVIIMLIEFVVR